MKRLFLLIAFVFSLSAMANVDITQKKSDDAKFVQVVDVGITTVAIIPINPQVDYFFLDSLEVAQNQFINVLIYPEADYQYTASVYDVGIGKNDLLAENLILKAKLQEANRKIIDLNKKLRNLQYNLTGNPNSDNRNRKARDGIIRAY